MFLGLLVCSAAAMSMPEPVPLTGLRITSAVLAERIGREGDRVRWMLVGLWSMLLQNIDLAQSAFRDIAILWSLLIVT